MKKSKFTDMKSMLKLLAFFCSLLLSFLVNNAYSQVFTTPNNSFGTKLNRESPDSTFYVPTFPTVPVDTLGLHSQGFGGKGEKLKKAALYYDSTHHKGYWWDPSIKAWLEMGSGGGVDTILITPIGDGSPKIQTLWTTSDGNMRTSRLVPGLYTIPFINPDSGVGFNTDTSMLATWLKIVAQYGPPSGLGIIPTIYNSNGRIPENRYVNVSGHMLKIDSVRDYWIALNSVPGIYNGVYTIVDTANDIYITTTQSQTGGAGFKKGFTRQVGGVGSGGLSGGANPYYMEIIDSGRIFLIDQFGNYILMASTTYGQPGFTINPAGGKFSVYNLPSTTDTTKKALVYDPVFQTISYMDLWSRAGGGGGGGGGFTVQSITSGSSGTVTGGQYIVWFNPASALATYTLTLPASPTAGQIVRITFGGTITSGNVLNAFTVLPNIGQSILDNTPPAGSSVTADNSFEYEALSSTVWHRHKL